MAGERFHFELLASHHDRAVFSCGVEALDRYFRQQASQDQRRWLAAPYVLLNGTSGLVVGYYTLSTYTIVPSSLPANLSRKLPRYDSLPAILLGRLAVDQRFQGRGFGKLLLMDALRRCAAASTRISAMAVVVDAKDDAARRFYERHGFTRFEDHPNRLYLPMTTIVRLELGDQSGGFDDGL